MKETSKQIRALVHKTVSELSIIHSDKTGIKSSPENWSKKEILGHLIDSALNNHQRCVRAGYGTAVQFPAYNQNEWVHIQHYNELDWHDLIRFWNELNQHLCHVIEHLPDEVRHNECNIGKEELVTLEYVIKDYFNHMQHHIDQIVG
ncbi:MAG: DinB family protein [Calditrichaceae bacterium]